MTIFQKGGSTHAPLTLLVTRVVLLHKAYGVSNPLIPQLYIEAQPKLLTYIETSNQKKKIEESRPYEFLNKALVLDFTMIGSDCSTRSGVTQFKDGRFKFETFLSLSDDIFG